tara:strand:- start:914 stop:1168 length:255 start_codon:yes stop_codon:yes gene_type:complete
MIRNVLILLVCTIFLSGCKGGAKLFTKLLDKIIDNSTKQIDHSYTHIHPSGLIRCGTNLINNKIINQNKEYCNKNERDLKREYE